MTPPPQKIRSGRRPTIDTRCLGPADLTKALGAIADECREARNEARYARSGEIDAERAFERGDEPAALRAGKQAFLDRAAAARRLRALAYRLRAVLLWAAYDWDASPESPYAKVPHDEEAMLWRAIAEADGGECRGE